METTEFWNVNPRNLYLVSFSFNLNIFEIEFATHFPSECSFIVGDNKNSMLTL